MPGMTDQVPSERRSNETGPAGDQDPHLKSFTTNRHWQPTLQWITPWKRNFRSGVMSLILSDMRANVTGRAGISDSLTSNSRSWVSIPPRNEFRVVTNVILLLVWLIAHDEKKGIFVTKSLRGPYIRWQQQSDVAAIKKKRFLFSSVITINLDHALSANHKLCATSMRMSASHRFGWSSQCEDAFN
jgi:hypothetical protein